MGLGACERTDQLQRPCRRPDRLERARCGVSRRGVRGDGAGGWRRTARSPAVAIGRPDGTERLMNELATIIFGLASGGIYALVVVGLVLTYRMSRFVNLAHGAMGMFVTYVFWQFTVEWNIPR